MIEKFIRWILVLPGSLASYIIVSYIFHLGTDNLSNEVASAKTSSGGTASCAHDGQESASFTGN